MYVCVCVLLGTEASPSKMLDFTSEVCLQAEKKCFLMKLTATIFIAVYVYDVYVTVCV